MGENDYSKSTGGKDRKRDKYSGKIAETPESVSALHN